MTKRKLPDQLQKRGRKTTFDKRFIEVAKRMAYLGATDQDLAIAFGVTIKCVIEWRAKIVSGVIGILVTTSRTPKHFK